MRNAIAHTNDGTPRYFRMRATHSIRYITTRLSDNFKLPYDGVLAHVISQERISLNA